MRVLVLITTLALVGVLVGSAFAGEDLTLSWSKGIRMKSEDGNFSLKLGGRVMNDWAWFDYDDAVGNPQDATEFRRALGETDK